MVASLEKFLFGIVDYAGLFPPAQLPLEAALRNYRNYASSRARWMLSRFICPAGSLERAAGLWRDLSPGTPLPVSALCAATEASEFRRQLEQVQRLLSDSTIHVEMLELRAPVEGIRSLENWILELVRELASLKLHPLPAFVEAPGAVADELLPLLRAAAHPGRLGFKLRCGGATAEAFPPAHTVAAVLAGCSAQEVPFKATAGLHHPLHHFDSNLGVGSHGFVNLFAAGLLAASASRTLQILESCLLEEDARAFAFSEDGLEWHGNSLSTDDIEKLRNRQIISFGSCSFREPLEDLMKLSWLPQTVASTIAE